MHLCVTPQPSTYKPGTRCYVVYPIAIARGIVKRDKRTGQLYFVNDDRPYDWRMPINEKGECTYSTHAHIRLARLSDRAVAAKFQQMRDEEAASVADARTRLSSVSDDQAVRLAKNL